jgi:hypothetical protein
MNDLTLPGRFGLILIRDQIGRCYICHVPFYSQRDMAAHMATPEHKDAVDAAQAEREEQKRRLALFHDDEQADTEVEAHLKKVGERMKAEGRWEVKPSERAGFS